MWCLVGAWVPAWVVVSAPAWRGSGLGRLCWSGGAITPEQLEAGLEAQRQTQQRLGATLVSQGAITEPMLVQALSEALSMPVVELRRSTVDWAAVHLVRARFCEQHELFPYALESVGGRRQLVVAMTDPLNQPAIDEIEFTTGLKVSPRVAALSAVRARHPALLPQGARRGRRPARPGPRAPAPPGAPGTASGPPARPAVPARAAEDDDEEVIVGEELPPAEKTERTSLAELIRRARGAAPPEARPGRAPRAARRASSACWMTWTTSSAAACARSRTGWRSWSASSGR